MDGLKQKLKVGVYGSLHSNQLPKIMKIIVLISGPFKSFFCEAKISEPIQEFQLKMTRASARNIEKSFTKQISYRLLSF